MPTNKPRVTFMISQEKLSEVESYRFDNRIKNQSQAILSLIEKGLESLESGSKTAPSLSDEAMKLAKDYEGLDRYGKKQVRTTADIEMERMEDFTRTTSETAPKTKIIPLIGSSFAAGRGDPDFGNPWEDYEVPIDTAADFAVRINGDSMEPYLPNGTIQLCRKGDPLDGDVAALLVDGEFVCKQVCRDMYNNLYLFSLNRARADADQTIHPNSGREVSCFGTVIMEKRIPLPMG